MEKLLKKKIIIIIIGAIILPRKIPNLIQTLFNGVKIGDLTSPKTKNNRDKHKKNKLKSLCLK